MHQILNLEKRSGVTMDTLKFQAFSSHNLFETSFRVPPSYVMQKMRQGYNQYV